MADLIELLGAMDIAKQLAEIGNVRMSSLFPDYVQIVGNWSYVIDENKVIIGTISTDSGLVPFGSSGMYPPELLAPDVISSSDSIALAHINPSESGDYIYALEIYMPRTSNRKYSGVGAFTMAYNPRSQSTAEYTVDLTQPMPIAPVSANVSSKVYLTANLEDINSNNEWILEIWVTSASDSNFKNQVFNHKFTVIPEQFQNNVSGLITTVTPAYTTNSYSMVNTVQVIIPRDIQKAYDDYSGLLATTSKRTTYLYAFVTGSAFLSS